MAPRRIGWPLSAVALAALGACLDHTARYGPERDDAAMAAIAGTFVESGGGALALSLCEDIAASEGWSPECRYQHVVQGGGRGVAHEEEWSRVGCGGCLFIVVAYVEGTVEGGPFAQPAVVRGRVELQSGHDDDPYAFPYSLELECEGAQACRISGSLDAAGALELAATMDGAPASRHALAFQAAAGCP